MVVVKDNAAKVIESDKTAEPSPEVRMREVLKRISEDAAKRAKEYARESEVPAGGE